MSNLDSGCYIKCDHCGELVEDDNALTTQERFLIAGLSIARNKFLELPRQHPQEMQEFDTALHMIQNLILMRPTVRAEGLVKS